MPRRVPNEVIVELQKRAENVRNVSIVAHVDHGKTTLADALISSNGIISSRSVTDQMRYLDSREDEQLRGITMKSSVISLHHKNTAGDHLVNLIDSPGHIDFSSEVSTAVRLSDGCLVVVDVVEGVCPQTKAVLRQAWLERLKPVLVLNKIDRLILEKKFTMLEAYHRLNQVLEQANAAVALLFSAEDNWTTGIGVIDDSKIYFAPESGNVVFGAAFHTWGFTIDYFADIYAKKLGARKNVLKRALWGDYYINMKQKKIVKGALEKGKDPAFCTYILKYFYEIYNLVADKNKEKCMAFAQQLKIKIYPREEKAIMTSPDSFLTSLLGQWLPISNAALKLVCFISKMIAVPKKELPQNRRGPLSMEEIRARRAAAEEAAAKASAVESNEIVEVKRSDSEEESHVFIAIGRVFSGKISKGDRIHGLGAKHRVGESTFSEEITIGELYLVMGKDLLSIDVAPAGALVGIGGIKEASTMIINTGTLSSTLRCPSFAPVYMEAVPILRVAVEPEDLMEMEKLREGLKLLNVADPCVEIMDTATGELVLGACGEVHLEKCLDDLETRDVKSPHDFHLTSGKRSAPIVPFRETLIEAPKVDELGESFGQQQEEIDQASGSVTLYTINRQARIKVQAFPLPSSVRLFLETRSEDLRSIILGKASLEFNDEIRSSLMDVFHKAGFAKSSATVDQIIAFGPEGFGPNILLNMVEINIKSLDQQLISGFQVAANSGPMMEEPMAGVGFRLLEWEIIQEDNFDITLTSGQLMSTVKEACRKSFSILHKRLLAAMYTCEIQASCEVLGKVYGVIGKRDGKILEEDMVEGTDLFNIKAALPVIESFGFADEIRKKTSGLASPQLRFSHWSEVEGDPWWVPTTEEEIQHYGEKADYESTAKKYMNLIRKRKGLWIEQKTVEHAEKQRTITKNK
ncbi:unnamed protein product [Oikopleura dioica]|uniref:Ribosome assembly protein 1 n=1 Tax=Oikopleura dioica TaxID=34765 RepID=E4XHD7_OIKDI|nr:unnamed protein product [Oikopleura dioica]